MLDSPSFSKPGLFVVGTDTEVGKTLVTCAIAAALRGRGLRVGVCKPFASDCRKERGELVSADAEALAHFADCRLPLGTIAPVRYREPLAPAVAAEALGEPVPWADVAHALAQVHNAHDVVLVEGVGGLLVPLDPGDASVTVLDLVDALGWPAVVVARSTLGTLNHTAMTVKLLRDRRCAVAGVVMNATDAEAGPGDDPSVLTNRRWVERMTGVPVLASLPAVEPEQAQPQRGVIDVDLLAPIEQVDWLALTRTRRGARVIE